MRRLPLVIVLGLTFWPSSSSRGRSAHGKIMGSTNASLTDPAYCNAGHNVGKLALGISNGGILGTRMWSTSEDCFTGEPVSSGEYPRGSGSVYLWGAAFWLGVVIGDDTLVSTGFDGWSAPGKEFHPDESPRGDMIHRSTMNPAAPSFDSAVSEQDFVARFADTCLDCLGVVYHPYDDRPHIPIGVEITQYSYAWSSTHADDFVLFDIRIRNMRPEPVSEFFFGLYVDGDVHPSEQVGGIGAIDDITGLLTTAPLPHPTLDCQLEVETNLAWIADNEGELALVAYPGVPHVTAMTFLGWQAESARPSYNWWISNQNSEYDFGPQTRFTYRIFATGGSGTPLADRDKYHLLSNGEIDYDQIRTATIGATDSIWTPPPPIAPFIAQGMDARYLLSIGPFTIEPDQELSIPFAYVAGENLHMVLDNQANLPEDPDTYQSHLDFSDLVSNAVMADWVYDNPGVDTDGDGYAGEYQICDGDTVWIRGDGVPDWCASSPPAASTFRVEPLPGALQIRWNGIRCETAVDGLSQEVDFEGYRAYLSTTGEPGSYACIGSYDVEDFTVYCWDTAGSDWQLSSVRLTLEQSLCYYAPGGCDDLSWHPLDYPRHAPFVMPGYPDSVFYFEPILANASRFGLETPFVKRFPKAARPNYMRPEDVPIDSVDYFLTENGQFKFYEYEFVVESLLPQHPYWVVITAFDYGSPGGGGAPLESGIVSNAIAVRTLSADSSCCVDVAGNADCDFDELVDIADVAVMIDFLFISRTPLCCLSEADINKSGGETPDLHDVTLADIALLIDHLFINQGPLPECP